MTHDMHGRRFRCQGAEESVRWQGIGPPSFCPFCGQQSPIQRLRSQEDA